MEDSAGPLAVAAASFAASKEVSRVIYEFLSPGAKEGGEVIASYVRIFRAENVAKVFEKAKKFVKESEKEQQSIHPRILFPLIEKCSLEDDDDLQDWWAHLLATAATTTEDAEFHQTAVNLIGQITPKEAQIMNYLYERLDKNKSALKKFDLNADPEYSYSRGPLFSQKQINEGFIVGKIDNPNIINRSSPMQNLNFINRILRLQHLLLIRISPYEPTREFTLMPDTSLSLTFLGERFMRHVSRPES